MRASDRVPRPTQARRVAALVAVLTICALSGCLPPASLHPFCSPDQEAFDPALLGSWAEIEDPNPALVVEKGDTGAYSVRIALDEGPDPLWFYSGGRLFRLSDVTLLDLEAHTVPDTAAGRLMPFPMILGHTLALVELEGDTLRLSGLDPTWWKEELERDPKSLRHEVLEGQDPDLVLTASTEELQRFLERRLRDDPEALDHLFDRDDAPLVRMKAER